MGNQNKPRSQRQLKVAEEIRHVLSDAFIRGDFHLTAKENFFVTVSEVQISPDLKNATAFIMPLAGKDSERVMALVNELVPELRRQIAKRLMLRVLPRLTFKLDTTFEVAGRMNDILNTPRVLQDIKKEDEE